MSSLVFLFFIASGNKKKICSCQNSVPILCGNASSQFLLFDHLRSSVWVFINLTNICFFSWYFFYLSIKNCDTFLKKRFLIFF